MATNNKELGPRWVVAHCGARDRYQLPIAFHEVGQLHRFVTDWYSPLDSTIVGALLSHSPRHFRTVLAQRYRPELPSRFVEDLKLRGSLTRFLHSDDRTLALDRKLGEYAARVASENDSPLLVTSYYGWSAFPRLSRHSRRVLFQLHPHPWFLRELYRKQESLGNSLGTFHSESEMRVGDELLRCWGQESLDAELVIATSSFTRKSLIHAGVTPDRIQVIPYGVDCRIFTNVKDSPSGKPKVLFIGQPSPRKGFQNLLDVWERLDNQGAELHIASGSTNNRRELSSGGPITWYERLALSDLIGLMNRCDLLVLPSIAEGFGHVLLESLSCGLPILCSDATAGPDILRGWDRRFIFAAGDWDGFANRLDYWLANVDRLRKMRDSARHLAEALTWERFRESLRNSCNRAWAGSS